MVLRSVLIGLILGLVTGLSPRPILPLLIGEVVRYGLRSGLAGLTGSLMAEGLLAAALVVITVLLDQTTLIALTAAELIAAIGLFYMTYQVGVTLPKVRAVAVEDVSDQIRLGHWPGLAGLRRAALVTLGSSLSWALWTLVGTAIVLSLPGGLSAVPWLVGGWLTGILVAQAGVLLAAGLGSLRLDTAWLRGLTVLAVATLWLSGVSLLTAAVRELASILLH